MYGNKVLSAQLLEVSTLGVGMALRLKRDAWSMVKRLRQETNEHAPPSPPLHHVRVDTSLWGVSSNVAQHQHYRRTEWRGCRRIVRFAPVQC